MSNRWRLRQYWVYATLAHCFIVLAFLMGHGIESSALHLSVTTDIFVLLFTTIAGYVFGKVSDTRFNNREDDFAMNEATKLGSWVTRRLVIFITISIAIVATLYIVVYGNDTQLNLRLATGFIYLHGALIQTYVFGAIIDDNTLKAKLKTA